MPVILTLLDKREGWMENTWTSYVYGRQMLISEDGTPRAKPVLINLIAMFREQFWISFINMLCRFNFPFDFKSISEISSVFNFSRFPGCRQFRLHENRKFCYQV